MSKRWLQIFLWASIVGIMDGLGIHVLRVMQQSYGFNAVVISYLALGNICGVILALEEKLGVNHGQ